MTNGAKAESVYCVLRSSAGNMRIIIADPSSPAAQTFLNLASNGFYDGTTFFRLIHDFIVQGGDPLGTGAGDGGSWIAGEMPNAALPYRRGNVALASTQGRRHSCQFFICLADLPSLPNQYPVIGSIHPKDLPVLEKINDWEVVASAQPSPAIVIKSMTVASRVAS